MADARLKLTNKVEMIAPTAAFTRQWALACGAAKQAAWQLALATDEVVSNVIRFAFEADSAEFHISFEHHTTYLEVIVDELGEPVDLEKYTYDPRLALEHGQFEGIGLALIRQLVDDFIFLNKGKSGKEFRLVKHLPHGHIADIENAQPLVTSESQDTYDIAAADASQAEVLSKLIYRTYGYTYPKEEMYYPNKVAQMLAKGKKFGVIARSTTGEAVGYFAIIKIPQSQIGEVAEAVVSPQHRSKGIMKKMMGQLLTMAGERGLVGVFAEATTIHEISQKVNAQFQYKSTALLLNAFPIIDSRGFMPSRQQRLSVVIEYLALHRRPRIELFLPPCYRTLLKAIFASLGTLVIAKKSESSPLPQESELVLKLSYRYKAAWLMVMVYGEDFLVQVDKRVEQLRKRHYHVLNLDLPLYLAPTQNIVNDLKAMGFVFSGLMPQLHQDQDYLRMQKLFEPESVRLSYIATYSPMARRIKRLIGKELRHGTLPG